MISIGKCGLLLCVLCSVVKLAFSETDGTSTSSPPKSGRTNRKYYDAEIYTGTENDKYPYGEHVPRSLVAKKYAIPYKHSGSAIMKKSGTNLNWSVWKGEEDNSENEDGSYNNDGPKWQSPPTGWNNDAAWAADPMTITLLKNAMAEMKGDNKPAGFLSKITADPALLLIAASIPISLLLAAVLPAIMNHLMNGNNVPTVTTTATGNMGRSSRVDIMPYLSPIMEAIGTFGIRSISNPDCMQKIFCQVAQDKIGIHDSKYFKKAASVARLLSHGNWLESFGVKDLVHSLSNGNCESVRCSHSTKKETVKSRYSQKVHSNSVKK